MAKAVEHERAPPANLSVFLCCFLRLEDSMCPLRVGAVQLLVMVTPAQPGPETTPLNVVQDWFEELKQKVPAK